MTDRHFGVVGALLLTAVAGIVAAGWAASRRDPRPPLPDPMAEVRVVERHLYILHGLTDEGVAGPWVCEPANIGEGPKVRRGP